MALLHVASQGAIYSKTRLTQINTKKLLTSKPNGLVLRGPYFGTRTCPFSVTCLKNDVAPASTTGERKVILFDGFEPAIFTPPKDLKRSDFPADFLFGASTSAIQTEGDGKEGGRGSSTWDFMIQAQLGKKGVDSYHLYKEDVKLLKEMGMTAYRFSIAWPRILPTGTVDGGINQEGIQYYKNFIQELLDNGIAPVITLFHFDLPVNVQKQKGFMSKKIIKYFTDFAKICFDNFGDQVKIWSTINEPFVFGSFGYKLGLDGPEASDPLGPYIATHNIILCHAAVTKLYREDYQKSQKGKMGICLPCKWYTPHSTDPRDQVASNILMDFMLGWYMEPFYHGDYPESMKKFVKGLPEFTEEERKMVKGAYDYIGLNYYTSRYSKVNTTVDAQKGVINIQLVESTTDENGNSIGWQAEGQPDIYVHPDGLRNLLLVMKDKYGNPEVFVTENGVPVLLPVSDSVPNLIAQGKTDELKKAFIDEYRCQHAEDHLTAVREAKRAGANVNGYFVWSLMDNMEVGAGYDVRFGLNFTDYHDNHKRYPKLSAIWFKEFLAEETKEEEHKKAKKQGGILPHIKILPF